MATSTVITWASGILIDRANNKKNKTEQEKTKEKKLWVALSFISNLAILFFFKYFDPNLVEAKDAEPSNTKR